MATNLLCSLEASLDCCLAVDRGIPDLLSSAPRNPAGLSPTRRCSEEVLRHA